MQFILIYISNTHFAKSNKESRGEEKEEAPRRRIAMCIGSPCHEMGSVAHATLFSPPRQSVRNNTASSRGAAGEEHAEAFSRGRVRLMVARRAKKSRKPSRKLRFCEYIHIYIHLKLYMYVQYNLRRSSLRPEAKGEQKWKPLV